MKYSRVLTWMIAIAFVLAGGKSAFAQEADLLIKRVREKLNRVNDYQAEGMLVADIPFMKLPDSKVTIYYKNPNKFRIKKQEGISVVPKGGVSINLNSLFAGNNFSVVPAGRTTLNGNSVSIVKLVPLEDNSEVVISTLHIDDKNALILKSSTTTRENGSYQMEFSYGKYQEYGLPDRVVFLFNLKEYKLPKGVTFEYDPGTDKSKDRAKDNGKGQVRIVYSSYVINKGVPNSVFN